LAQVKGSFWVPFVASVRRAGLQPDKHAANAAVARWLREVANARVHATTGDIPVARLPIETISLPALCDEQSARGRASPPAHKAIMAYQHPLAISDELIVGAIV
jgi:hypothetical protein